MAWRLFVHWALENFGSFRHLRILQNIHLYAANLRIGNSSKYFMHYAIPQNIITHLAHQHLTSPVLHPPPTRHRDGMITLSEYWKCCLFSQRDSQLCCSVPIVALVWNAKLRKWQRLKCEKSAKYLSHFRRSRFRTFAFHTFAFSKCENTNVLICEKMRKLVKCASVLCLILTIGIGGDT